MRVGRETGDETRPRTEPIGRGGDDDEQGLGLVNAAHDNHNADGREVTAMS